MQDNQPLQETKLQVKIIFEQEILTLNLEESKQIYTLLNYQKMKKKILQSFKYTVSQINKIQLNILNFYPFAQLSIPIHHPKNYTYLINDMVSRTITPITLKVTPLADLTKRKKRQKAAVEFDSDGSIQSVEDQAVNRLIEVNKPKIPPYQDKQNIVRCFFCQRSSKETADIKISGRIYGPFDNKSYGHHLCLLWCSDIYFDQQEQIRGVPKAIANTKAIKCSYCKQKGASFYCHTQSCRQAGHYKCAVKSNWLFDWIKYKTYCPKCSRGGEEKGAEEKEKEKVGEVKQLPE